MPSLTATCKLCTKPFLIIEQEQKFYKKMDLPHPENCPECRQKERLVLRNERRLYKRTCDRCKKEMIATYAPESKYVVYCQECFWAHMS